MCEKHKEKYFKIQYQKEINARNFYDKNMKTSPLKYQYWFEDEPWKWIVISYTSSPNKFSSILFWET